MADGAANPYLAVATVLQAALLGVVDKLTLPRARTLTVWKTFGPQGMPRHRLVVLLMRLRRTGAL